MYRNTLFLLPVVALTSACATPTVVQERKFTDVDLSCEQLQLEIGEAERFEQEARDERGVTGTNVAALVLFWPALIATYANTDAAIAAANERQRHLHGIYEEKGCVEATDDVPSDVSTDDALTVAPTVTPVAQKLPAS